MHLLWIAEFVLSPSPDDAGPLRSSPCSWSPPDGGAGVLSVILLYFSKWRAFLSWGYVISRPSYSEEIWENQSQGLDWFILGSQTNTHRNSLSPLSRSSSPYLSILLLLCSSFLLICVSHQQATHNLNYST